MPIDVASIRGATVPDVWSAWTADDVILYQLGLGAGVPPTEARELAYTYEDGLTVVPSYGVVPVMPAVLGMLEMPGMDIDMAHVLHGDQALEVHGPLPTSAEVVTRGRVTEVLDKGQAAVVVLETVTSDARDGQPLFTNRVGMFVRGEGGFGGPRGSAPGNVPPDRDPDHVVACPTLPQQALIYRLSGDKNPMHADPGLAARGGFDQPILHGLCIFGIACKATVDTVLDGDVGRVARYEARFAGVVFPGETIEVSLWEESEHIVLTARCAERNSPVLSNAAMWLRTDP